MGAREETGVSGVTTAPHLGRVSTGHVNREPEGLCGPLGPSGTELESHKFLLFKRKGAKLSFVTWQFCFPVDHFYWFDKFYIISLSFLALF